ncbi:MAG: hypothetical protein HY721_03240 [Planctomycetes bacterium]|nr:hypothetical protein [Planctomycetota bacterium]
MTWRTRQRFNSSSCPCSATAALALLLATWAAGAPDAHGSPPPEEAAEPPRTFALETYARRSFNYLTRMVDAEGLPYFNVFWTEPAEAAHDWPDFGDVLSRQLQAAVMGRRMTGEALPIEAVWRRKVIGLIEPASGLLARPPTSWCQATADPGNQALTLYALVTAYVDSPDEALRSAIVKMAGGLVARAERQADAGFLGGFGIKSLMACARTLRHEAASKLAGAQVRRVFAEGGLFSPDNTFRHGGHVHGNLRTLVGAADYALYAGDPVLYSRVDALYRYVRSEATRFGFLPEVIGRKGDVVATETCALMDYVGLAVTLANHGHPEYWGDVERVVRNHLVESQARDLSWLRSDPSRPDTGQFSWREVAGRMAGGYAGWTSPNHFLAARETLHWGGPELSGKTRAFQNCCGGSGTHAFYGTRWYGWSPSGTTSPRAGRTSRRRKCLSTTARMAPDRSTSASACSRTPTLIPRPSTSTTERPTSGTGWSGARGRGLAAADPARSALRVGRP